MLFKYNTGVRWAVGSADVETLSHAVTDLLLVRGQPVLPALQTWFAGVDVTPSLQALTSLSHDIVGGPGRDAATERGGLEGLRQWVVIIIKDFFVRFGIRIVPSKRSSVLPPRPKATVPPRPKETVPPRPQETVVDRLWPRMLPHQRVVVDFLRRLYIKGDVNKTDAEEWCARNGFTPIAGDQLVALTKLGTDRVFFPTLGAFLVSATGRAAMKILFSLDTTWRRSDEGRTNHALEMARLDVFFDGPAGRAMLLDKPRLQQFLTGTADESTIAMETQLMNKYLDEYVASTAGRAAMDRAIYRRAQSVT